MEAIIAATGWQAHTVRGAMSGALGKKLGLVVTSAKEEGRGPRAGVSDQPVSLKSAQQRLRAQTHIGVWIRNVSLREKDLDVKLSCSNSRLPQGIALPTHPKWRHHDYFCYLQKRARVHVWTQTRERFLSVLAFGRALPVPISRYADISIKCHLIGC